jgi:hypothetical protein
VAALVMPAPAEVVDGLFARELELAAEWEALGEEIATGTAAAGALALDDSPALAAETARLAELHTRRGVVAAALQEARRRRVEASRAHQAARAAELRAAAAEKRQEAEERGVLTRQLLDQLEAHEGARYGPVQPLRNPGDDIIVRVPRTQELREQAEQLEAQAREAEREGVLARGQASGATVAELWERVRALGAWQLGPSYPGLREWADSVEPQRAHAVAREARRPPDYQRPVVYELTWRDGQVDPARSGVRVQGGD